MSSYVSNFASLVGKYDGSTLQGGAALDTSAMVGTGDLSLNAAANQYLSNPNAYTTSATGVTYSGWFYPAGAQAANACIFDMSNAATTISLAMNSNGTMTASYNGTAMTTSASANLSQWNFFTYIIGPLSGGSAFQLLYLNGGSTPAVTNTAGTYLSNTTFSSTTLGYGAGLGYFNGKIDDYRFYNRGLAPPEVAVLYNFNYLSATVTPTVTVTADPSFGVLRLTGIFSYVTITRTVSTGTTGSNATFTVSASALTPSVDYQYVTWTDAGIVAGNTYQYAVMPFVLSNYGATVTVNV